jgi:hypothetical protein
MAIVKEWQPKSEYAKEKVDETKMVKLSITEMDWRQLKSKAILKGITVQDLAGQVLREHIFKH